MNPSQSKEDLYVDTGYKPKIRIMSSPLESILARWGMRTTGQPISGLRPYRHAVWFGMSPTKHDEVAVMTVSSTGSITNAREARWYCGVADAALLPTNPLEPETIALEALADQALQRVAQDSDEYNIIETAIVKSLVLLEGEAAVDAYTTAKRLQHLERASAEYWRNQF